MSGGMIGADPDNLRALSTHFRFTSDRLSTIETQLSVAVFRAAWQGPDAARFTADWHLHHRSRLREAAEHLRQTAELLEAEAAQQESASAT